MKTMKTLCVVTFVFVGCVQAEGGAMEAPEPPSDPGIAPEPPAGSSHAALAPGAPLDAGTDAEPPPIDPDAGPVGGVDDEDNDGVPDEIDVCSKTAKGAIVWTTGEWIGCAGGQKRDGGVWGGTDTDGDGIADKKDRCSKTPKGKRVWTYGEWVGCAGGEVRDK